MASRKYSPSLSPLSHLQILPCLRTWGSRTRWSDETARWPHRALSLVAPHLMSPHLKSNKNKVIYNKVTHNKVTKTRSNKTRSQMTRSQNMVIKNNLNSLNSILVRSYSSSGLGSGVKITYNTVVVWYWPWDSSSCWVSCLVMGRWRGRAILMKLCSSNWWTDQRLLSSFIRHLNNNNRGETLLVSITAKSCRST